jgi:hypothetical protein
VSHSSFFVLLKPLFQYAVRIATVKFDCICVCLRSFWQPGVLNLETESYSFFIRARKRAHQENRTPQRNGNFEEILPEFYLSNWTEQRKLGETAKQLEEKRETQLPCKQTSQPATLLTVELHSSFLVSFVSMSFCDFFSEMARRWMKLIIFVFVQLIEHRPGVYDKCHPKQLFQEGQNKFVLWIIFTWVEEVLVRTYLSIYYDRINIINWHCRNKVHKIKNYKHVLSGMSTPIWDYLSN